MRRTCVTGFGAFGNADGGREMMREARRVAGHQLQRLRTQQVTTSKAHKEQYIAAFIEAQSATLTHRHAIAARYAGLVSSTVSLPAYGIPVAPAAPTLPCAEVHRSEDFVTQQDAAQPVDRHARGETRVAFGAWRFDEARVQKALHSIDVRVHCIIHEARTPPAFAAIALQRCIPCHLSCVQDYLALLRHGRTYGCVEDNNKHGAVARDGVVAELFCIEPFSELLCRLQRRDGRLGEGGVALVRRSLVSLTLHSLVRHHGWSTARAFLQWYLSDSSLMTTVVASSSSSSSALWAETSASRGGLTGAAREDALVRAEVSQHVAVLCEAARYEQIGSVTMDDLEALCAYAVEVLRKAGVTPRLLPVVAAPVLSLVPETVSTDTAETNAAGQSTSMPPGCVGAAVAVTGDAAVSRVHRLVRRYLLQPPSPGGKASLCYMPAIAWAEYVRAVYRAGAGIDEIRRVVDELTDPAQTRHAARLLRDVRVWNAYLFCVNASHAVQVYEQNLPHYSVVENAATTAALMEALLRSPRTTDATHRAEGWGGAGLSRAECVQRAYDAWQRLQARAGTLCIGTCSVFEAVIHLHEARRDLLSLLRLCVDYDGFLIYFGVDQGWWAGEGLERMLRHVAKIHAREGSAPFVAAFRAAVMVTHAGHDVPPAVQHCLLRAIEKLENVTRETVSYGGPETTWQDGKVELTAELLGALL